MLALVAVVAGAWLAFREPRAQGESLSHWLQLGAQPDRFDEAATPSPQREAAIREIGAKAIPILLAKLQATDSPWKHKLYKWFKKQDFVPVEFTWEHEEQQQAIYGFTVLGSNAVAALPALEIMFTNPATAWIAGQAMGEIGGAALPALRQGFTNSVREIRQAALAGTFRPNLARATLEDVRPLLNDSDRLVATVAIRQLMFHSTREEATRLAIEVLGDNSARWRGIVLNLFNQVSIHTNQVVPVLVRLLEDPDLRLRRVVTNTLKQLDPVAAAAAGINTNPPPVRGGPRRRGSTGTNAPAAPQQ